MEQEKPLMELFNQPEDLETRIQKHIQEAKVNEQKKRIEELTKAAREREQAQMEAEQKEQEPYSPELDAPKKSAEPQPDIEEFLKKQASMASAAANRKMVYLAYSYAHGNPPYVKPLKNDLQGAGYLVFNPLDAVEEQFDPEHKDALIGLGSKVAAPICRFLKLSEDLLLPLTDSKVIQTIRKGDAKMEVDSMIFKEMFFLMRSSVVICDLIEEPIGCELMQKLFFAKIFDIPVIAISPMGKSVSAYIQKYVKVLLTDDFNSTNVLPLVRAYTA